MIRTVIRIDEEKCTGCGVCIPNCHEGALQIIDGKARLISDLMCDGLGACVGHCPFGAITLEEMESSPYDEILVMENIYSKGYNTIFAHLKHLKDHDLKKYVKQGIDWLRANRTKIDFDPEMLLAKLHDPSDSSTAFSMPHHRMSVESNETCGCPGSRSISFNPCDFTLETETKSQPSRLSQWPVQLHLLNPAVGFLQNADLLVAADCTAYALGDFHNIYLSGKALAIACPKLDRGLDIYIGKLREMIEESNIKSITLLIMEVPCCRGLLQVVQEAIETSSRKVPLKMVVVGIQGQILSETLI